MKESTRPCPWHEANHDGSVKPGEHHQGLGKVVGFSPRPDCVEAEQFERAAVVTGVVA